MAREITWQNRFRAAAALLDDCAVLARIGRAAERVTASEEPRAEPLAGGRRLRGASRVAFFAGSFNPLTQAHVALADAARRAASLDVVIWVCATASVDKERVERATLVDRLAQMRAFVARRRGDALVLLNRGLYVDEARMIRSLLAPEADLVILVGFDKIVQIFDSRYYRDRDATLRDLFSLASILVAPRNDDGAEALTTLLAQPENRPFAEHVRNLDAPPTWAHDSSTEARTLAGRQPPDITAISGLLPPEGAALALHTGAYQPSERADDHYAIRECWLRALATLPPALTRRLPPLSQLIQLAVSEDTLGRDLRAWLKLSGETGHADHGSEALSVLLGIA